MSPRTECIYLTIRYFFVLEFILERGVEEESAGGQCKLRLTHLNTTGSGRYLTWANLSRIDGERDEL